MGKKRAHWIAWMVAGLIGVGVVGTLVGAVSDPPQPTCPPLDRTFMVLPDDRAYATLQFLDRARRLNDAGQCVVYANWSRDRGQYIFQAKKPGEPDRKARSIYIPEADLHR